MKFSPLVLLGLFYVLVASPAFARAENGDYAFIGNIEGRLTVEQYDRGVEAGTYHATLDMYLHGQQFCVTGDSTAAFHALLASRNFDKKRTLQVAQNGSITYHTDLTVCDRTEDDVDGPVCVSSHVVPDGAFIQIPKCESAGDPNEVCPPGYSYTGYECIHD